MKKIFLIFALTGFLAACSTSPKEAEESTAMADASHDAWESAPAGSKASSGPSRVEPAQPLSSNPYADLNAAIKSQSEERIRSVAHQILRQVKDDPKALNALGMSAYRSGKLDLAAYFLGKAQQKSPNEGEIASNLGLVELARGEKTAAIKSFRRALELKSEDGLAAANLGALYVEAKDYSKAATVLSMSYRQGVRDAKNLNNYGIALVATGQYDKALSTYDEALRQSSSNRDVLYNKAILLIENMGRMQDGLDLVNRVKFMGSPSESRDKLSHLENKAKAGLNK
ncbi:MAG: tetratricopeptide repeat protein [Bdellovibrionaceae bacterium]|nr:tetratricopeptide repeat protein [Pseudobdellovibrionaceae bacterium]